MSNLDNAFHILNKKDQDNCEHFEQDMFTPLWDDTIRKCAKCGKEWKKRRETHCPKCKINEYEPDGFCSICNTLMEEIK